VGSKNIDLAVRVIYASASQVRARATAMVFISAGFKLSLELHAQSVTIRIICIVHSLLLALEMHPRIVKTNDSIACSRESFALGNRNEMLPFLGLAGSGGESSSPHPTSQRCDALHMRWWLCR
jgi:hypothetical protein